MRIKIGYLKEKINSWYSTVFLVFILATVSFFYLLSSANQINQKEKIIFAEYRIAVDGTLEFIRHKEKDFIAAFYYASIGMALVSVDGESLMVNKSLCRLLGYMNQELLKQRFQDFPHPADSDTDSKYVQQMLRKDIDTYQMEKHYFKKGGSFVWVMLTASLLWEMQRPKYFIRQIKDITERKLLQYPMKDERDRYRQIIWGTSADNWKSNIQICETRINEPWANIIDYSLSELEPEYVIGKKFWNYLWHQINQETHEQLKQAIKKRGAKGEEISYEVAASDINKHATSFSPDCILNQIIQVHEWG